MESLRSVLTPTLLRQVVAARLPYDRHAPLDFSFVGRAVFNDDSFGTNIKDSVFPVLQILSRLGLDKVPDLMDFLPEPHSKDFPELCLGMVILLDQAPRALCHGIDERWAFAYFDVISQRFAKSWSSLPVDVRPDLYHRWASATGTSFEYWAVARIWFGAPLVHAESAETQDTALAYTGHTRKMVELATGRADPHLARRDEILSDLYAFPRVFSEGPPQGPQVTLATFIFWIVMLMDIHAPIIRKFGHYPYKNAIQGRESSPEEKEWMDKTGHFGDASPDVARKIREDVERGIWTPLGKQ